MPISLSFGPRNHFVSMVPFFFIVKPSKSKHILSGCIRPILSSMWDVSDVWKATVTVHETYLNGLGEDFYLFVQEISEVDFS